MKASIVVPTYNMSNHLDWTLAFLVQQELKAEDSFEILIVDDGSVDSTRDIAEAYAGDSRLQRIYRARDEKSCRARARNLGISRSSGDLCIFLDSGVIVERS